MTGIANDTIPEFQARISRFRTTYVNDWSRWLDTTDINRPRELKKILGSWQACRGNTLCDVDDMTGLIKIAEPHIESLRSFDLSKESAFTLPACNAIKELWRIFENLSYERINPDRKKRSPRNGLAGAVGISKAAMLVTDGRLGPAFDSRVSKKLECRTIKSDSDWLAEMQKASHDIMAFEKGVTSRKGPLRTLAAAHNKRNQLFVGSTKFRVVCE